MKTDRIPSVTVIQPDGTKVVGGLASWGDGWAVINGKRYPMAAMSTRRHV